MFLFILAAKSSHIYAASREECAPRRLFPSLPMADELPSGWAPVCPSVGLLVTRPPTSLNCGIVRRGSASAAQLCAMRTVLFLLEASSPPFILGLAIFIFLFAAHLLSHYAARARTHARIATPLQGGRPERPGLLPFCFLTIRQQVARWWRAAEDGWMACCFFWLLLSYQKNIIHFFCEAGAM